MCTGSNFILGAPQVAVPLLATDSLLSPEKVLVTADKFHVALTCIQVRLRACVLPGLVSGSN